MQNVTIDRHKYIGGSDIPIIMAISPFKTRFELLQEKAQIKENIFDGNDYTEYGNVMEPKIREYINSVTGSNFIEDKVVEGDIRYHADGHDIENNELLEIKTTSQVKENLEDYKGYLVQILFGMQQYEAREGILAVYSRPDDFNEELNPDRLQMFNIYIDDHGELLEKINNAVDNFRKDLEIMRSNPFTTDEDLKPAVIVELTNQIMSLENEIARLKRAEERQKELKAELKKNMQKHGFKKWTTNSGVQITLVEDSPGKTVEEFDSKKFIKENPKLAQEYTSLKEKKGRAGYVKITLPKAQ